MLGFLNRENELQAYTFEGSVNSDVVIACIDDFSFALTKRTVLVIDNAKVHTSEAFFAKIDAWKTKGFGDFLSSDLFTGTEFDRDSVALYQV